MILIYVLMAVLLAGLIALTGRVYDITPRSFWFGVRYHAVKWRTELRQNAELRRDARMR